MAYFEDLLNFLGRNTFERLLSLSFLIIAAYLFYRWIFKPLSQMIKHLWIFWKARKSSTIFLEVTPPKHSEKSLLATQQLFTVLRQALSKSTVASLEITSSHEDGLRYIISIQSNRAEIFRRHIASFIPEVKFHELKANPISNGRLITIRQLKQVRHYAFPLQENDQLDQSDIVSYIAGSMNKLRSDETMTLQMVVSAYDSPGVSRIYNKILSKGYAQIDSRIRSFVLSRWWVWLAALLLGFITNNILVGISAAPVLIVISFFIKYKEPVLTSNEVELYQSILAKLGQPLFRTDIRIAIAADTTQRLNQLSQDMKSSFAPLSNPFQALGGSRIPETKLGQRLRVFKFGNRLPSLLTVSSNVFSASELASIYHFPYGMIKTEGMVRSHSRTLPAPLSMKNNAFDVVIGQNNHHGATTAIGLTPAERERHIFIIGGTGNGKTTMMQYQIVQDIQNGKGIAVVDPHGDMAELLLKHIPEERIDDVVYFNPDDLTHPIGLNILELTPGLEGDELLREKDLVTESVVSIFRKIFSEDDSGGHRIEYVLRNAIHTALTVEDATLFTIYRLLNDPAYRKKIVATLEDEDLKNFWKNELGKAGGMQQVKMMAGITSKIGRFLFSASAKRILEQPKSTVNFDEILDGKILICNLSKGLLGEDTSELFGIAILAKIQLAALRRARVKQSERKPFYLYVDEFQNFATQSFVQMLSEARKYKLFLTMAEQSTSQQDDQKMVDIILANVGTVICFRTGNPADEQLILPLFKPYIEEGEISNLASYNFYIRIAAVKTQEPFSGETVLIGDAGSEEMAVKVIQASRAKNAIIYKKSIEKETSRPHRTKTTQTKLPD